MKYENFQKAEELVKKINKQTNLLSNIDETTNAVRVVDKAGWIITHVEQQHQGSEVCDEMWALSHSYVEAMKKIVARKIQLLKAELAEL